MKVSYLNSSNSYDETETGAGVSLSVNSLLFASL